MENITFDTPPRIAAALTELGALTCETFAGPNGSRLRFYLLNGTYVIVRLYANGNGYEVYTPVDQGHAVEATLDALLEIATDGFDELADGLCPDCGDSTENGGLCAGCRSNADVRGA